MRERLERSSVTPGILAFLVLAVGFLVVGCATSDKFRQLAFAGIATGSRLALVALGFVVIYKATGVINFAQGGFVALGAYLAYDFHQTLGVPFYLSVVLAMLGVAVVAALVQRFLLQRLIGRPPVTLIMVTVGLLLVIQQVIEAIWGTSPLPLGAPWGVDAVDIAGVTVKVVDVWTVVLAGLAVAVFFVFFRYSRFGLAMRATAIDQEAALAQGISSKRVFIVSWAIAGLVAGLAGVMIAATPTGVAPAINLVAIAAFPAIILGGLDSPGGAIVGGLVIGIAQELTAGYQPEHAAWLGTSFNLVMPYVVMILILLVRPYGLFGTRQVERV